MNKNLKRGQVVKTTRKVVVNDYVVDPMFIKNRRDTNDSIIDSPIYSYSSKLWFVKHSTSYLHKGISVGHYAVYHESELELVELPQIIETDDDY